MGVSMILFSDFTSNVNRILKLYFGLSILALVVLSVINLVGSNVYPELYGASDRKIIFFIAHVAYVLGILISPIMLAYIGCRMTLALGAAGTALTLGSLIWPLVLTVYAASILIGFSGAFIITSGYTFIVTFTKLSSVSRNAAVLFTTIEASQLASNCLVFFNLEFSRTGSFVYITTGMLLFLVVVGVTFALHTKPTQPVEIDEETGQQRLHDEWAKIFNKSTKMDLILFLPMFFYSGTLMVLLQKNYGTWPTFTLEVMRYGFDFGTMSSLTLSMSEVVCGIVLILAGNEIEAFGRAFTAALGFISQAIACFFLIGLVPKEDILPSAQMPDEIANSAVVMVILMDVLLGFGIALIMTQVYAKLMEQYPCSPGIAVTILKILQALGVFTAFFYSSFITLPYQSTLCLLIGLVAIFCFVFMERTPVEDEVCQAEIHAI